MLQLGQKREYVVWPGLGINLKNSFKSFNIVHKLLDILSVRDLIFHYAR